MITSHYMRYFFVIIFVINIKSSQLLLAMEEQDNQKSKQINAPQPYNESYSATIVTLGIYWAHRLNEYANRFLDQNPETLQKACKKLKKFYQKSIVEYSVLPLDIKDNKKEKEEMKPEPSCLTIALNLKHLLSIKLDDITFDIECKSSAFKPFLNHAYKQVLGNPLMQNYLKQTADLLHNSKENETDSIISSRKNPFPNYLPRILRTMILMQHPESLSPHNYHTETVSVSTFLKFDNDKNNNNEKDEEEKKKNIKQWNKYRSQIQILEPTNYFGSVNLHEDNRMITYTGNKNTISIWENFSGNRHDFIGHTSYINCFIVLSMKYIATCSDDTTIKIWNSSTYKCLNTLIGHKKPVTCIAMLDRDRIASCSKDKTIKIWNIYKGSCLNTLKGHTESVNCIIKFNKIFLISCSNDKTVRIWNGYTNDCLILGKHDKPVKCVAAPDQNTIYSYSPENTISCCWKIPSLKDTILRKIEIPSLVEQSVDPSKIQNQKISD